MAKIKEEIFKEAAIYFLESELNSGWWDLKHVCESGRMAGGSAFPGGAVCSLGSITGTDEAHPAKNILVEIGNQKRKFTIKEIYDICHSKKHKENLKRKK